MTPSGSLLAWIEPSGPRKFTAAFVGEDAVMDTRKHFLGRAPATQLCFSTEEARQWIETQAEAFDLPIKWVREFPGHSSE